MAEGTSAMGNCAEPVEPTRDVPSPSASRAEGHRRRELTLLLGLLLIPLWQSSFLIHPEGLRSKYRVLAATGLHDEQRFVYFYYYLGLFPVATEAADLVYSREGAQDLLRRRGQTLVMEWGHTLRYGDLGRMFLYLPSAWWHGSPERLSVRPTHAAVFILALMALFAAFWWVERALLGGIAVLLLGSNPFQVYEVYANENIFGWPISTALIVLALHLPLLAARRPARWFVWAVPVATGLFLATVRQVRSEPAAVLVSALFAYAVMPSARWRVKLALAGLLAVSFVALSQGYRGYFSHKFRQACRRVEAAGGHPYPGPRDVHHMVWHVVWCGLGDFGSKHGYAWNDVEAARYAVPILREKHGVAVPEWDQQSHGFDAYWDAARKYYKTPYELPHYNDVLREKVLGDIARDPLWFLGILVRRAWRLLSETTPVGLSLGTAQVTLPIHGLLAVVVLGVLVWTRSWLLVEVLVFSLPLCSTAFLMYSGGGHCGYSCYHIFAVAVLLAWLIEALGATYRRQPRGPGHRASKAMNGSGGRSSC